MVCLNDGNKTRIDVSTVRESVLDLPLVSCGLATVCVWQGTVGSDHYSVLGKINTAVAVTADSRGGRFVFEKADWVKSQTVSERYLNQIGDDLDTEAVEWSYLVLSGGEGVAVTN